MTTKVNSRMADHSISNVYDTVAAMKADTSLSVGETAETRGYYSPNDGGKAKYVIEAAQSVDNFGSHTLDNGNTAIISLVAATSTAEANAEQFGAINGQDSQLNLEAAFAAVTTVNFSQNLQFSGPLPIPNNKKLRGNSTRNESGGLRVLTHTGTGQALQMGIGTMLSGFTLAGSNGTRGIVSQDVELVTVEDLTVKGFQVGAYVSGQWLSAWTNVGIRENGIGLHINDTARETSDFRLVSVDINKNTTTQLRMDGTDIDTIRPTSVRFFGCQIEDGNSGADNVTALINMADRCYWNMCAINQRAVNTQAAMRLGIVRACRFSSCYHQASNTAPAIVTNGVLSCELISPEFRGAGLSINAPTGTCDGLTVLGGDWETTKISDPDGAVTTLSPNGAIFGKRPGGDNTVFVRSSVPGERIHIQALDSDGTTWRGMFIGAGTDEDQISLSNSYLQLPPEANPPANPISGTLANSDGSGGGFDGTSGAGLYRYTGTVWSHLG